MQINNKKNLFIFFSLVIIRTINAPLSLCFCPFLEEFPPLSLANVLFQRYRHLKVLSDIDSRNQSLPFLLNS